ncbi:MAG: hypothetical protein IPM06_19030 [Rhizobiales bacterium]|nr:hypothetical protein [Hyphomicrobiales bacterium]
MANEQTRGDGNQGFVSAGLPEEGRRRRPVRARPPPRPAKTAGIVRIGGMAMRQGRQRRRPPARPGLCQTAYVAKNGEECCATTRTSPPSPRLPQGILGDDELIEIGRMRRSSSDEWVNLIGSVENSPAAAPVRAGFSPAGAGPPRQLMNHNYLGDGERLCRAADGTPSRQKSYPTAAERQAAETRARLPGSR